MQHYRISLPLAIAHYRNGDLTAKGLLHFYLKIRLKEGWSLKETPQQIYTKLGISRTAFYTALSRLKAEGMIEWSVPDSTIFSIKLAVCECGQPSTIADDQSMIADDQFTIADDQSMIADDQSMIADNQPLNPPSPEASKPSSYYSQIYFNSLSDTREREFEFLNKIPEINRERFLNFAQSKANRLPSPPQLIQKWIAANSNWLLLEFQQEVPIKKVEQASAPVQNSYTLEEIKRLYPHSWHQAAAHFGLLQET